MPSASIEVVTATNEKVGPGSYTADTFRVPPAEPRHKVGTYVFASKSARIGPGSSNPNRTSEPGHATLREDQKAWNVAENRQMRGKSFEHTQRWKRLPGPGTNLPSQVIPPGPGSYGRLHSWPAGGFRGTARGFNHVVMPHAM